MQEKAELKAAVKEERRAGQCLKKSIKKKKKYIRKKLSNNYFIFKT